MTTKYGFIDKLNLFLGIYGQMFAGILRFSWWLPFFVLAIFQVIGLAALLWFYAPGWASIIYPVLRLFLPSEAFHYPQYYLALPSIYSVFENFILGPTVWVILSAVAVYRFGGFYSEENLRFRDGLSRAFRSYLPLLAVWLIETVVVFIVMYAPSQALRSFVAGSTKRMLAASVGLQMAGFAVSAFLVYVIPGIIIGGKRIGTALAESMKLCLGNFFLTYFIIFIPSTVRLASDTFLTDLAPSIISNFNPDLIPAILLARIALGVLVNMFIYGSAVAVYREMNS